MDHLYSLALLPPPPVAAPLAGYRRSFDPSRADSFVPHLTLKLPFSLGSGSLTSETALEEVAGALCATPPPGAVRRVGVFDSCGRHGHVLHAQVDPAPLRRLHEILVLGLWRAGAATEKISPEREVELFFPHITLAQGLSQRAAMEACEQVRSSFSTTSFLASSLWIGRSRDGHSWELGATLSFSTAG
jgi:2'-5' RNA ligase